MEKNCLVHIYHSTELKIYICGPLVAFVVLGWP